MKMFGRLLFTIAFALLLSGCFMHTVVSNGYGVESPDKRLTLRAQFHGAPRKAYIDMSKKRVFIAIWRKDSDYLHHDGERLFLGKYDFIGADLSSHVEWHGPEDVTVDFYDFGDRVNSYDARKAGIASNHVARVAFVFDAKTGKFVERK